VNQVRALPGLAAQLCVGIAQRCRGRVGAAALGRRARPRLGQRQLRARSRGNVTVAVVRCRRLRANVLLAGLNRGQAAAQAGQRSVGLDVKPVDRQVRAIDQAVLAAQRHRPQEQPLKQRRVDEPPRLGMADRLVHRQPLAESVAQKPPDVDAHRRDSQQLAHRVDALQRADQHQLDQHDRIDRRATDIQRVIPRRLRPHELPIHDRVQSPKPVIDRHKLVKTHHLDLQRRRLPLRHTHSHARKVLKPAGQTKPFWTGP